MKISKQLIIIVCVALLFSGATLGGILIHAHITHQRETEAMLEAERQEQRDFVAPYIRVNYAFGMGSDPGEAGRSEWEIEHIYEGSGLYKSPREIDQEKNGWGIDSHKYLHLRFYERETGIILAYETVIDYFSEEFEPDGSLRLYNNGKHPEIQAFVEWMWEGRYQEAVREYRRRLSEMYSDYFHDHKDAGFKSQVFYSLSPQMLDALARAEADPDYMLDLTSLQQAGY